MSKDIFNQIAEGLNEALEVAQGDKEAYKLHVPSEIDIKAIREKTKLSQKDFSSTFGFGLDQLKQWEQGRSRPVKALRAYLLLIDTNPIGILEALREINIKRMQEHAQPECVAN